MLEGAAVDFFLEGVAHDAVELLGAGAFVGAAEVAHVGLGVGDALAHVLVDDDALLFGGEQGLGVLAVEHEQAFVDVGDALDEGQFDVQARLGDDALDLSLGFRG